MSRHEFNVCSNVSKVCPCCARVGYALSPYAGAYMLHVRPTADVECEFADTANIQHMQ